MIIVEDQNISMIDFARKHSQSIRFPDGEEWLFLGIWWIRIEPELPGRIFLYPFGEPLPQRLVDFVKADREYVVEFKQDVRKYPEV